MGGELKGRLNGLLLRSFDKNSIFIFSAALSAFFATFYILLKTSSFIFYPEIYKGEFDINFFFIVSAFLSIFFGIILTLPSVLFYLYFYKSDNKDFLSLSKDRKAGLLVLELVLPCIILFRLLMAYVFEDKLIFLALSLGLILILGLSYFLHERSQFYKNIQRGSEIKQLIKKLVSHTFLTILICFLLSYNVLVFLISDLNVWIFWSSDVDSLLEPVVLVTLSLIPSCIVFYFRAWWSVIVAVLIAIIYVLLIVPKEYSPINTWLTKNHIVNYKDTIFSFKESKCFDILDKNINVEKLENGSCKIKDSYNVDYAKSGSYSISVNTTNSEKVILHVDKKDIKDIADITLKFDQSRINNIAKIYQDIFDTKIIVNLKTNLKSYTAKSQGVRSDIKLKFSESKDKALALGVYINDTEHLIDLKQSAMVLDGLHTGSIERELAKDENSVLYSKLINRLNLHRNRGGINKGWTFANSNINFHEILSDPKLRESFVKLKYLKQKKIESNDFIYAWHREIHTQVLFAHLPKKNLSISILFDKSKNKLEISDPAVANLLTSLLR